MPKTTKRPALRFAGFSDEWEERKLGDIGKARSGVGFPDVEQGGTEGIPFYKVSDMNLVGNEIEMTRSNNYVTNEQIEKKRWNPVDDVPAIFFAKVGAAVMLNRKRLCRFPFLLDNNTMAYSLYNDYWNMEFAKAAFTKIDFTKLIQVGALPSYNSGDVEDIRVMLPPMKEQNKIGQYFAHLDHLIALHERKYSKLMNVKKFMLEKMFPKDGAKVPALRFAGFSDEWEERKINDVANFSKGNGYSKGDLKGSGTPIILYGRLYTKYQFEIEGVDTFADIRSGAVFSKGNEVIVPASGETAEDIARAAAILKSGILLGGDLNILHPFTFMNPSFVALVISNGPPQKELARKAQGKSIVHIHNSDIQEVTVRYPDRAEQDKISRTFSKLDHLLSLHRQELERLQNVKKSCLEKMFA